MKPTDSSSSPRKSNTMQEKRKVLFVSEGHATEVDYFNALCEARYDLGIDDLLDLIVLDRYSSMDGFSNPRILVEITNEYLEYLNTGKHTERMFIGMILDSVIKYHKELSNDKGAIVADIKNCITKNITNNMVEQENEAIKNCEDMLHEKYHIPDIEFVKDDIEYDPDLDMVCIIADRDKGTNTPKHYSEFLNMCKDKGYRPYITNPKFEFWLILHFDDIDKFLSDLKDEKRCLTTLNGILQEKELTKKHGDYGSLIYHIPETFEYEKVFSKNLYELKESIGSNLFELMRDLGIKPNR